MHTHLLAATVWRWRQGQPVEPLLRRIAAEETVLISSGGSDWLDSSGKAEKVEGGLTIGKLSVNGQELGPCYENADKQIPAGAYGGVLRYTSQKYFVQSPGGKLGKTGDFLLEVARVPGRTDILFHAGNKAEHSMGCILCGPASTDSSRTRRCLSVSRASSRRCVPARRPASRA